MEFELTPEPSTLLSPRRFRLLEPFHLFLRSEDGRETGPIRARPASPLRIRYAFAELGTFAVELAARAETAQPEMVVLELVERVRITEHMTFEVLDPSERGSRLIESRHRRGARYATTQGSLSRSAELAEREAALLEAEAGEQRRLLARLRELVDQPRIEGAREERRLAAEGRGYLTPRNDYQGFFPFQIRTEAEIRALEDEEALAYAEALRYMFRATPTLHLEPDEERVPSEGRLGRARVGITWDSEWRGGGRFIEFFPVAPRLRPDDQERLTRENTYRFAPSDLIKVVLREGVGVALMPAETAHRLKTTSDIMSLLDVVDVIAMFLCPVGAMMTRGLRALAARVASRSMRAVLRRRVVRATALRMSRRGLTEPAAERAVLRAASRPSAVERAAGQVVEAAPRPRPRPAPRVRRPVRDTPRRRQTGDEPWRDVPPHLARRPNRPPESTQAAHPDQAVGQAARATQAPMRAAGRSGPPGGGPGPTPTGRTLVVGRVPGGPRSAIPDVGRPELMDRRRAARATHPWFLEEALQRDPSLRGQFGDVFVERMGIRANVQPGISGVGLTPAGVAGARGLLRPGGMFRILQEVTPHQSWATLEREIRGLLSRGFSNIVVQEHIEVGVRHIYVSATRI